jgi:aspartate kinase
VGVIVQKYGGSSVADASRIKGVAARVVRAAAIGQRVCVVVSAMGDSTDGLLDLAAQISPVPQARELDMLLSAGERISMALLSMAIMDMGRDAISFTGSQAGIVTDTSHGRARIVAGFQGVSTEFDVTTLGRGGSDTTAVALAAALGADACEIYTDVEGVFSADPRIVSDARKLHMVSYEEMLEMSAAGARVLMLRAVEYARNHGVLIHVRSSFSENDGTWIREEDERMEQAIISGIAHDASEAKVSVLGVPDRPGVAAQLLRPLANEGVNIDMIVQNASADGRTDIFFTLPKEDLARAESLLRVVTKVVEADGFETDSDIAKVSLIGAGMKSHPGVAVDMFEALAEENINIEIISTSSIRISCVIRAADVDRAVAAIHARFELANEAVRRENHPLTATDQIRAIRGTDSLASEGTQ